MPEQENTQKGDLLRVTVADGKYTVVQSAKGELYALRYNEIWRSCVGDNLILALAYEVDKLRTAPLFAVQHMENVTVEGGTTWMPRAPVLFRTAEGQLKHASELLTKLNFERREGETDLEHVEAFQRCSDVHDDTEDDTATDDHRQRYGETEFDFDLHDVLFWDFDTAKINA